MEDANIVAYASFWKRFYAYGYDSLILTITVVLVDWLMGNAAFAQTSVQDVENSIQILVQAGLLPMGTTAAALPLNLEVGSLFDWHDMVLPMMISALYNIFFITGYWQATPGKRFCGIYVVNDAGERLSLLQSTLRHATSGLSMLIGGIGYLTIFFTREKCAPHDMICGTRVIRGKITH